MNALTGWIAGGVYSENIGGIKKWRFPTAVSNFCAKYLLPVLDDFRAPDRTNNLTERQRQYYQGPAQQAEQSAAATSPVELPITEENIQTIMAMGFTDRAAVERALRNNGNNVERAVNSLL